MKSKFFVTFGQKYRHEAHPSGLNVNPNGYVIIHAYTEEMARDIAFATFGDAFAFLYPKASFEPQYFPLGPTLELGTSGE